MQVFKHVAEVTASTILVSTVSQILSLVSTLILLNPCVLSLANPDTPLKVLVSTTPTACGLPPSLNACLLAVALPSKTNLKSSPVKQCLTACGSTLLSFVLLHALTPTMNLLLVPPTLVASGILIVESAVRSVPSLKLLMFVLLLDLVFGTEQLVFVLNNVLTVTPPMTLVVKMMLASGMFQLNSAIPSVLASLLKVLALPFLLANG